ncbi:membrane integrity-associated transporter subunit PqiC [Maribius pontilimi]|uniref:Membrane integrity-associated transporter subunit PqiC n=1 Tax=Palleronia pontilimi TaxID=1964209 RepID=A0A934IKJ5_9RHOB|nr:ABC-type transport auxiliary lipoprotein family protein [Palleronia pontilimi]MBJ3763679.1 membrane integrity-associated transporter subunit PqiC [Palleronia pontilimi]
MMPPSDLTRRAALLGGVCALGGCSALASLDAASQPLDTYDLSPRAGATAGRRTSRTLVVAQPDAPAAIASDRIMVKPDAVSVTYLPDARWTDELPLVIQSLLIRSISGTGRVGYVGPAQGGPVPDTALLVRVDAFQVDIGPDGGATARIDMALTLLRDRDQRVIATRSFAQAGSAASDAPAAIVAAFQALLDTLLPAMADWAVQRV